MKQNQVEVIRVRYEQVLENIHKSSKIRIDQSNPVRLVVVSKTHPVETISTAIKAGIREFGENYAEEAVEKISTLKLINAITWHMIGHVQSRKANLVANSFNFVHSLDSYKLALRLEHFAAENNRILPVLFECNVTGEQTKFGFNTFERSSWQALAEIAIKISELPHLEIHGLMTMPPLYDDPEKNRPAFQKLRELRDYLKTKAASINWNDLSMGTSSDYCVAVEEGATLVRVGSAILGSRPQIANK